MTWAEKVGPGSGDNNRMKGSTIIKIIPMIGVRERLRILEKAMVWAGEREERRIQQLTKKIIALEQQNWFLQGKVAGMKEDFSRELFTQEKTNQEYLYRIDCLSMSILDH